MRHLSGPMKPGEREALRIVAVPDPTSRFIMTEPKTLREASCADDYDPNSMPVDKARALIRTFLEPVSATERVHIRQALRVGEAGAGRHGGVALVFPCQQA